MLEFTKLKLKSKTAKLLLVLLIICGVIGVGKYIKHERLENKVVVFEMRFNEISEDLNVEINEVDVLGIKAQKEQLIKLREDVQKQHIYHLKNSTEQMMWNELDLALGYYIEAIDLMLETVENPWGLLTGVPEQQINTINNEIEKHTNMYKQYKKQLKIESLEGMNADISAKEL